LTTENNIYNIRNSRSSRFEVKIHCFKNSSTFKETFRLLKRVLPRDNMHCHLSNADLSGCWPHYDLDDLGVIFDKNLTFADPVADPGGANPAMAPHRSWQWSLAPLGAETVMVQLW